MAGDSSSKTEKPTPKKLKDARREGQIARSPDVSAWLGILVASFILEHTARAVMRDARELMIAATLLIHQPETAGALAILGKGLRACLLDSLPLALTMVVIGIASTGAQGGIHVSAKKLKPKMERVNPLKGLKRMLGMQSVWELVKQLTKSAVVAILVWRAVKKTMPVLVGSGHLALDQVVNTVVSAAMGMLRITAMAALVLAAADYAVQWKRTRKQLMMSHKEVTDEHKQAEGDPHMKGAIRSRALALSRNRMMADVADADVVLVNPTHVAVALKYDAARGAPRVIAKGAGVLAARIRKIASENRVPLVEDVPLARALHKSCKVGQEIPAELYTAVARVLAFVMSLRAKGSAAGTHRVPRPRQLTQAPAQQPR
jgi:flagellar biosynthetic protein FlhB